MIVRYLVIAVLLVFLNRDSKAQNPMGVENGWGVWQAATGSYSGGVITWNATGIVPATPRFTLTSGNGADVCTPGPVSGSPDIPVVATGYGHASILLGQTQTNGNMGGCTGGCVEQLTYSFPVTNKDTDFIFSYAIVMEDAGHAASDQPFVSFCIVDPNGDTVQCSNIKYTAAPNLPGFYTSSCSINSVSYYKPWTMAGLNLNNYVGQTLKVIITNSDCGAGDHFAHSYWDFEGAMEPAYCTGQLLTICGPPSTPTNPLTYSWFKNGAHFPGGTNACIVTSPHPGDTFLLELKQPSGCYYYMKYIPIDTCVVYASVSTTPDTCGKQNGTATALPQNGNPPYSYLWSNGKTTQVITGLPAGTYTVTVTDANSTTAFATAVVYSSVVNVVDSVTPVACSGGNSGSASVSPTAGIPPFSYLWSNNQTTQAITGLSAGTYSVLVTDAAGCSMALAVQVTGGPLSVNPTFGPSSCSTCSNGSAQSNVTGGVPPLNYQWSSGHFTPNISGLLPGTYQVCVTDAQGCTACGIVNVLISGVSEILNNSVSIFPNPVSESIYVDFGNHNFGKMKIIFTDIVGRVLFSANKTAEGRINFNISNFLTGTYFLKLEIEDGSIAKKIVVVR